MKAMYPVQFDMPHAGLAWLQYYQPHNVWHCGYDLNKGKGNDDLGNPVVAPVKLDIDYVSPAPAGWNSNNGGFGWFVIGYSAAFGVWMRFAHLDSVSVKVGQTLKLGELLGKVGKTGATSAHLHWEVFGKELHDYIKPLNFRFYPSGKTKEWVMKHYVNPLQFVDDINAGDNWKEELEAEIKKLELLKDVDGYVTENTPHKQLQYGLNIYKKLDEKIEQLQKNITIKL